METLAQIRDLNSGTFGFVELALDKTTGQQVAVKFIERGDKVLSVLLSGHGFLALGYLEDFFIAAARVQDFCSWRLLLWYTVVW